MAAPFGRSRLDPVRVAEEQLAVDGAPVRLQHSGDLAPGSVLVRDLTEGGDDDDGVECPVGVRKASGIRTAGHDVAESAVARAAESVVEHGLLDVEDVEPPFGPDPLCDRQCVEAGPRADLEDPLAGPRLEDLSQAGPGDQRVRRIEREAQRIRASRRVPAQPQHHRRHRGRSEKEDARAAGTTLADHRHGATLSRAAGPVLEITLIRGSDCDDRYVQATGPPAEPGRRQVIALPIRSSRVATSPAVCPLPSATATCWGAIATSPAAYTPGRLVRISPST